jgi:hypothetical protein
MRSAVVALVVSISLLLPFTQPAPLRKFPKTDVNRIYLTKNLDNCENLCDTSFIVSRLALRCASPDVANEWFKALD